MTRFMDGKNIIAAVADNGAIGSGNSLLWHIPADMRYFRDLTTGSVVIMGRRTYESIGRPLPHRRNIVISRSDIRIEGAETAHSLEEAFAMAGDASCFVIGGGEIYRQAMALADRLYITEVHRTFEGADTFFPDISPEQWKEVSRSDRMTDEKSGLEFEFVTYIKRI